jgi:hypothetical protein
MQTRKGGNGKHSPVVPDRPQVLGADIALAATSLLRSNIARAPGENAPGANPPPQSRPGAGSAPWKSLPSALAAIQIRRERLPDAVLVFSATEAPPKP